MGSVDCGYAYVRRAAEVDEVTAELVDAGVAGEAISIDLCAEPRPVLLSRLEALLSRLRPGDRIVTPSIGRVAVSSSHLVTVVDRISVAGARLAVGDLALDFATDFGRGWRAGLVAGQAVERETARHRHRAGMTDASAGDRLKGRRPALSDEDHALALDMHARGEKSVTDLAAYFGVSRASMYRALARERQGRIARDLS